MSAIERLAREAVHERGAQQKPEELSALAAWLPKGWRALEIGTFAGGTAWFLDQVGLQVTAIDRDLSRMDPCNRIADIAYAESESASWLAASKERFNFIFIDGDHLYNGVKADWLQACGRKITVGGIVAFHDIATHDPPTVSEVDRLWAEIKDSGRYRTREIMYPPTSWGGIGLVLF